MRLYQSAQLYQLTPRGQVVTLLLHQRRVAEVAAQLQAHLRRFRAPPQLAGAPAGAAAAHAGWVSRQYAAVAELLSGRVDLTLLADQVPLAYCRTPSLRITIGSGLSTTLSYWLVLRY